MLIPSFSTGSLTSAPSSYLLCVVTKRQSTAKAELETSVRGQPVVGESGKEE